MAKFAMILILFVAVQLYDASCQCSIGCPIFWKAWGDGCYRFFDTTMTWEQALAECRTFSCAREGSLSDLVSIRSQAENDFVYDYWRSLDTGNTYLWIGLTDRDVEGTFAWTDGSATGYTNFATNQPDDHGGLEDYGHLLHADGKWNDHQNGFQCKYMCKISSA